MILEKYNMPCHAIDPIQDLFLESLSYVLQFDMHFLYALLCGQKFNSCKKWVLQTYPPLEESRPEIREALGNSLG
jgi:hypothetical protein